MKKPCKSTCSEEWWKGRIVNPKCFTVNEPRGAICLVSIGDKIISYKFKFANAKDAFNYDAFTPVIIYMYF